MAKTNMDAFLQPQFECHNRQKKQFVCNSGMVILHESSMLQWKQFIAGILSQKQNENAFPWKN